MPYKLESDWVGFVTKPSLKSGGPVGGGELCMISPKLLLLNDESNGDGGFSLLSSFGLFVVGDDSVLTSSDGEDGTEEKPAFEARVEFCAS